MQRRDDLLLSTRSPHHGAARKAHSMAYAARHRRGGEQVSSRRRSSRRFTPVRALYTRILTAIVVILVPVALLAVTFPPLRPTINDFGQMFPPASFEDLETRLIRFKTQSGTTITVLTLKSLEGGDIGEIAHDAFAALPLSDQERTRTVLLIVARKEQKVDIEAGPELAKLFPKPATTVKLQRQVEPYFNGLRSDLGIHSAAHYMMEVIKGEFQVDRVTEAEALENE